MNNLYDDIRNTPTFNRLEIGELLFAEYTCPLDSKIFELWTQQDYLVHVVSGKKTWHTSDASWTMHGGETLFLRKGAAVIEQHFEVDFCVLIFFVPDQLTREVVSSYLTELDSPPSSAGAQRPAIPVTSDVGLQAFIESMKTYFASDEKPTEALLRLKLKELILSILTSRANPELASYFCTLAGSSSPSLADIMEENFRYRLSMDEFARLCHRSLSSFKRDFRAHYNETPGRWLLEKRLDYAAALLRSQADKNITDIVFDSGFEDSSHFSKAFKKKFGTSPTDYRKVQNS